jgi:hypothetical protein
MSLFYRIANNHSRVPNWYERYARERTELFLFIMLKVDHLQMDSMMLFFYYSKLIELSNYVNTFICIFIIIVNNKRIWEEYKKIVSLTSEQAECSRSPGIITQVFKCKLLIEKQPWLKVLAKDSDLIYIWFDVSILSKFAFFTGKVRQLSIAF